MEFQPKKAKEKKRLLNRSAMISIIALVLAMLTSGIIIKVSGYSPIEAISAIFKGAFDGKAAIARTLVQSTPLILSGLAFTVAKKAQLINLGVEGQMYLGALAAAMVGSVDFGLPHALHLLVAILSGMVVGGLLAGIVGVMKVRFGSNEVIATIMLNSIAVLVSNYLASNPWKAVGSVTGQTEKILEKVRLARIIPHTQLTIAIAIAVLACVLMKWFFDHTISGYEIKVVGQNQTAAQIAGIKTGKVVILSMLLSGTIGGLAGSLHVLGVDGRFIVDFSPGYGFSGIAVAALAAGSPIGVILSGLVFGAIRSGAMLLDLKTNIPLTYADVVQALVILFVATPLLIIEMMQKSKQAMQAIIPSKKRGTES
ncbi:ABC transporter permease [Gottschalkiaceae bacterium SANA]|nr:ABC transporter permease [Gottschalkiaceae bacterium SANA]